MISFNQSLDKEILTQEEQTLLHDILNGKHENDFEVKIERKCLKIRRKGLKCKV